MYLYIYNIANIYNIYRYIIIYYIHTHSNIIWLRVREGKLPRLTLNILERSFVLSPRHQTVNPIPQMPMEPSIHLKKPGKNSVFFIHLSKPKPRMKSLQPLTTPHLHLTYLWAIPSPVCGKGEDPTFGQTHGSTWTWQIFRRQTHVFLISPKIGVMLTVNLVGTFHIWSSTHIIVLKTYFPLDSAKGSICVDVLESGTTVNLQTSSALAGRPNHKTPNSPNSIPWCLRWYGY